MRQILCVVDLSESSTRVLELAAIIATACRVQLQVIYPYRLIDQSHKGDMTSLRQRLELQAREKFEDLRNKVPQLNLVRCDFQPEIGFVADRINSHLRRNKVDMVIIGQGQTDLMNDGRSFDVQNLIRNTQLPFVIVPSDVQIEAAI